MQTMGLFSVVQAHPAHQRTSTTHDSHPPNVSFDSPLPSDNTTLLWSFCAHTPKGWSHSPLRISGNSLTTTLSSGLNMEHRSKPVSMNIILALLRSPHLEQSSGLRMEILEILEWFFLFGQCGMWIQNLKLGKTESQKRKDLREGQKKKNRWKFTRSSLEAAFQLYKQTIPL